MRNTALLVLALGVLACGCVERRLLIRSDPPGAPVRVNEKRVGRTPVDYDFAHYGTSSIRVGPIRDEQDRITHLEQTKTYRAEAPWYETFPIDFFFEVLYPGRLVDEHRVPRFDLVAEAEHTSRYEKEGPRPLLERARSYRERALSPVPEEAPAEPE
ncbi:MAG: PEGA domain-containing protein [Planctomycetota bacterium]